MALPHPTFINFKWYNMARTITRCPRSVPTSQLLSNLHWLPIHKRINFKVVTRHPNVHCPFYSTTCLPLQPHILPSTQSFAAFLQSVCPPSAQGKNRFRTSCFVLCCSSAHVRHVGHRLGLTCNTFVRSDNSIFSLYNHDAQQCCYLLN